jgi:hypothetical protein
MDSTLAKVVENRLGHFGWFAGHADDYLEHGHGVDIVLHT